MCISFVRGLNLAILAILVSLPAVVSGSNIADAHHPEIQGGQGSFYIHSLRSISATEQYCVDSTQSTLAFSTALDRVRNTLIVDNPSQSWDMKQGGYTDFRTTWDYECTQLSSATTPTRNEIEIEYHVQDVVQPSACGGTSCSIPDGATWSASDGRVEYQWYYVYLRGQLIKNGGGDTYHVVNHETGHVLGLRDGGPDAYLAEDRNDPYGGGCPGSIMHTSYYGCSTTLTWPSLSTDHVTVNDLIFGNPWP